MLMHKVKYTSLPYNLQQSFTNNQENLYYSTRQKQKLLTFTVIFSRTIKIIICL